MKYAALFILFVALSVLPSCKKNSSGESTALLAFLAGNGPSGGGPMAITGYGVDPEAGYTLADSRIYYLDANAGDDANGDGSSAAPWKTLVKVQSVMTSGDTVILRNGNYGPYTETLNPDPARTGWITFKADAGCAPVIGKVTLDYKSLSSAYLRFDGITFQITPDDSRSTWETGILLRDLNYVEIRNCEIFNTRSKYMLDNGIRIHDSGNVLVYRNHMHTMITSIVAVGSNSSTIYGNHIHELAEGSGLIYDTNSSNFIFELNNVYDSNESASDPDYTVPVHSASIEIKSSDIRVSKNVFHGIGSSQGLSVQEPNDGNRDIARSNIIIENNIVYDPHNTTFAIQNLGDHVIVRNNTFIGRLRTNTVFGASRLYVAFRVDSIANGHDGSGLQVYNNIVAGSAIIPLTSTMANNIFWSFYYYGTNFEWQISIPGNSVITPGADYPIEYFTNGFFNGIDADDDFTERHNMYKDFTLAAGSYAVNAGDVQNQTSGSLGSIAGTDGVGFIRNNGPSRSDTSHSAGCYEAGM